MAQNLVNLENVSQAYGTRQVLDAVSLGVNANERIGVVGRNGGGKSTLLRMIAKREQPESGRVTHTGGLSVGWLGQTDELNPQDTVGAAVLGTRAEHVWAGDARIRGVLGALLPTLDLEAPVGPLSGGERRRIALARLLVDDDDLLLLDEPTNHLDVEAVDWLAHHLADTRRSVVVVSHDRWLLDTACEQMWEVVDGTVHSYDGGYSAFVLARAERARIAAVDEARRSNLVRKELAWLRRGPPARTSKPRFRIDAANALIADEPPARDPYELARFASARLGKQVLDVEDVSLTLGDRKLIDDVTWRLGPGDRIGLVGVNGAGKTTLLRLLDGAVAPDSGRVKRGRTVSMGHLSQEVTELDPALRVLEAVEQVRQETRLDAGRGPKAATGRGVSSLGDSVTAGQLLERFGFAAARQWTPVGDLSGGERRRLQLMRLLLDEPNVLLLDEPTNDLDVETLNVVEDLLDRWAGVVVVVSHDRWFLERVTDSVYGLMGDGRLRHLPGGVEEYLRLRSAGGDGRGALLGATAVTTASTTAAGTSASAAPTATTNGAAGVSAADARAARKEMGRIERELGKLDREEERLHADLATHATDADKVQELDARLRATTAAREAAEERWLELSELT